MKNNHKFTTNLNLKYPFIWFYFMNGDFDWKEDTMKIS